LFFPDLQVLNIVVDKTLLTQTRMSDLTVSHWRRH